MKAIIQRVLSGGRPARRALGNSTVSSELTASDIESYYLSIIVDCLRRMLLPSDSFEVRVRRAGTSPTGLSAFAGYVRILKWDPLVTPIMLQNLPVIDARVRKVVLDSVILEATHFCGLWFQASSRTEGSPNSLLGMPCELVHQQVAASADSPA
jgi:hypothetical protein